MIGMNDAWLAGLLEGEGNFHLNNGYPGVRLKMVDYDVVRAAYEYANVGHFHKTKKYKDRQQCWEWTVTKTQDALDLMNRLLPYMGQRRTEKIHHVMDAYERKKNATLQRHQQTHKENQDPVHVYC